MGCCRRSMVVVGGAGSTHLAVPAEALSRCVVVDPLGLSSCGMSELTWWPRSRRCSEPGSPGPRPLGGHR